MILISATGGGSLATLRVSDPDFEGLGWWVDSHGFGDGGAVHPAPRDLIELVGVEHAQHQHGVDDDDPPEEGDGETPPAIAELEADDEVQEEDHVDDAVDDSLLEGDQEEHPRADEDPVFAEHVPHPASCTHKRETLSDVKCAQVKQ